MSIKTKLQNNNTDLQDILDTVNSLPEEKPDAFAVISVIYPEGSICTCSKDDRTFELDDTSGNGFFVVDEVGEWTVTATDPTEVNEPTTQTVEITKEGESVNVALTYALYLVKDGIALVATATNCAFNQYNGYLELYRSGSGYHYWTFDIDDITSYNTIEFEMWNSSGNSKTFGIVNASAYATDKDGNKAYIVKSQVPINSDFEVFTLDVSALIGAKRACVNTSGATTHIMKVKNIKLYK